MSVLIFSAVATLLALVGIFVYRNTVKNNKAFANNMRFSKKNMTLEE